MANMVYALDAPQVGWLARLSGDAEPGHPEFIRALYFNGIPNDETLASGMSPLSNVMVSLFNESSSAKLGRFGLSFARIDGKTEPIELVIDIYCDERFFNDIFSIRDSKLLYLHINGTTTVTNTNDFKDYYITGYRISIPTTAYMGFKRTKRSKS